MKKSVFLALATILGLFGGFAYSVEVTVLGPKRYVRTDGPPNLYSETFLGGQGTGTIIVQNGGVDGTDSVSGAIIKINGTEVFGVNDFSQQQKSFKKVISLSAGNSLDIELRSKPKTFLIIRIVIDIEADGAALIGQEGGRVVVDESNSPIAGYSVSFPAGSLNSPTVITLRHEPGIAVPLDYDTEEGVVFPAFRISPEDITLNEVATIRVPYLDENCDGVVDGTGLPACAGKLYFHNDGSQVAIFSESRVDTEEKAIVTSTNHFSIWIPVLSRLKKGSQVKYFIESVPSNPYYPAESFRKELKDSFSQWSHAIDDVVTFEETQDLDTSNLIIGARDFCDPRLLFEVRSLTCIDASAFFFRDLVGLVKRKLYFNVGLDQVSNPIFWFTEDYGSADRPSHGGGYISYAFKRTALHEIGHELGLPDYSEGEPPSPNNSTEKPSTELALMYYDWPGPLNYLVNLGQFDIKEARKLYDLGPGFPWLSFREGYPGVPGDGLTVDSYSGRYYYGYTLESPISIGQLLDGFVLAVFPPEDCQEVLYPNISFSTQDKTRCLIEWGGGGRPVQSVEFDGKKGYALFISKATIESWVDYLWGEYTNCYVTAQDLFITEIFVVKESSFLSDRLDAVTILPGLDFSPIRY